MLLTSLMKNNRFRFACAVAWSGGIVAIAMVYICGAELRALGSALFYVTAVLGAGAAGWLCADAFGRDGPLGIVCAAAGGVLMTLLGAGIGAGGLSVVTSGELRGAVWGPVGIVMAAHQPAAIVWALCMFVLHMFARQLRLLGPILWIGPNDA